MSSTDSTRKAAVFIVANSLDQIKRLPPELRPGELIDLGELHTDHFTSNCGMNPTSTELMEASRAFNRQLGQHMRTYGGTYYVLTPQRTLKTFMNAMRIPGILRNYWMRYGVYDREVLSAQATLGLLGDTTLVWYANKETTPIINELPGEITPVDALPPVQFPKHIEPVQPASEPRTQIAIAETKYFARCETEGCPTQIDITSNVEDLLRTGATEIAFTENIHRVCNACEKSYFGVISTVISDGEQVFGVELSSKPMRLSAVNDTTIVVLKSCNADEKDPIYLVAQEDFYSRHESHEDNIGHREFWYNENTCVVNWLRNVKQVIYDKRLDPHGIFEVYRLFSPAEIKKLTGRDVEEVLNRRTNLNDREIFGKLLPELFDPK